MEQQRSGTAHSRNDAVMYDTVAPSRGSIEGDMERMQPSEIRALVLDDEPESVELAKFFLRGDRHSGSYLLPPSKRPAKRSNRL